jgi:hypothetical protein
MVNKSPKTSGETYRDVPKEIKDKFRLWRDSAKWWRVAHWLSVFWSAVVMALFMASRKAPVLDEWWTLGLGGIGVGLSALTNIMGASDLTRTRELAAWELEEAMVRYRTDPSFDLVALGKAEARGLEILKTNGAKYRTKSSRGNEAKFPH